MAQIRHDMHHDVQGAVEGAQSLTDWRTLIRMNPWISLGIAATVGYLIVPKRRRETPTIVSVDAAPEQFARSAAPESTCPGAAQQVEHDSGRCLAWWRR